MTQKTRSNVKWLFFNLMWVGGMMLIYTGGYYDGSQEQYYTDIHSPMNKVWYIQKPVSCPADMNSIPDVTKNTNPYNSLDKKREIKICDKMITPIPRISMGKWAGSIVMILIALGLGVSDYADKKAKKYKNPIIGSVKWRVKI